MEFTGERYINNVDNAQISYEHWHRYFYATQFVHGKDVLDVACGEGYGADLMAQTARTVVGIDISQEAIDFARGHYPRNNISFVQGAAESIPLNGVKMFDVAVSFETLEHLDAASQESFLNEIRRLLKDEGIFIISTPNKLLYSDMPKYKNEFHRREFYENEFLEFLHRYFAHVSLSGQNIFTGSMMWRLDDLKQGESFSGYRVTLKGRGGVCSR